MLEFITAEDRQELQQRGIPLTEIDRQLQLFANPPRPIHLDRPCTLQDGIVALDDAERSRCLEAWQQAQGAGRFLKFVPASGAASRMFQALLSIAAESPAPSFAELQERATQQDNAARDTVEFFEKLPQFAFYDALLAGLQAAGKDIQDPKQHIAAILEFVLTPAGLDYANQPKGLLAFHQEEDGARTPVAEHLTEAALYASGETACRVHFTVSPQHQAGFEALLARVCEPIEAQFGVSFDISFSTQKPSTDLLAVDLENKPFRKQSGALLFRPGGHGALIENLGDLQGDIVFIKNIDNVTTQERNEATVVWKKLLAGYLVRIQQKMFHCLEQLQSPQVTATHVEDAMRLVREELSLPLPDTLAAAGREALRLHLVKLLDRPLRVCGMVRNTGEPGGGPFWIRDISGMGSRQIVERAQTDLQSTEQQAIFEQGTHFNPVDLVCSVRDCRGQQFDLSQFIDDNAVFLSKKSSEGRDLLALERPGLWNGAMAGWVTLFVEVPLDTFNPVKTVLDLLRPAHQPG